MQKSKINLEILLIQDQFPNYLTLKNKYDPRNDVHKKIICKWSQKLNIANNKIKIIIKTHKAKEDSVNQEWIKRLHKIIIVTYPNSPPNIKIVYLL